MTTTTVKPGRKFPPPCWTRDEALVLIQAYTERWNALHRAFLRNPDWDAVAEKVTTTCPDVTPPKTPAQCRHKMEKLRQRHRAEKQRAASFPGGKFFSSWFYFEAMEAMENGPGTESTGVPVLDQGRGIRFKPNPPTSDQNLVTIANPIYNHNHNQNSLYINTWANQLVENEDNESNGYINNSSPGYKYHNSSSFGGIRVKPVLPEPTRKLSKVVHDHEVDEDGEMWIKVPRTNENNWNNPSLSQGKKKENDGIHEVVSSIKLLGDGFMKMEKMKIDMAREIERMRMETEMKRNQLILDSQKQIVDVFLKGLIEIRKQPKIETMGDS